MASNMRACAVIALLASATAFVAMPAARLTHSGRALATSRVAHTAPLQMALSDWVPQPVKRIIGSVSNKKASSAPARGGSKEGVALFRQLGVSEDATFEEIQDAVDRLKVKYSTDRKQQIRLDKIKDEIMDLRLKQRMSKQSPRAGGVMQAEEAEKFLATRGKKKDASYMLSCADADCHAAAALRVDYA
eukprot:1152-Heterococcus_DN1.PRE.1